MYEISDFTWIGTTVFINVLIMNSPIGAIRLYEAIDSIVSGIDSDTAWQETFFKPPSFIIRKMGCLITSLAFCSHSAHEIVFPSNTNLVFWGVKMIYCRNPSGLVTRLVIKQLFS